MSNFKHFLRLYRTRSTLTQSDIAFLSGSTDDTNICKVEKCKRKPSIELVLTYHYLFNIPIELFFRPQKETIITNLIDRIEHLIPDLKKGGIVYS